MELYVQPFTVHKRFALTISRGTTAQTTNVWVKISHNHSDNGLEGWGEASPFSVGATQTTEQICQALQGIAPQLHGLSPFDRQAIDALIQKAELPTAAQAGLDLALHDWLGKAAQLPLWQLWGLDRSRIAPTSVTIGISDPDAASQRLRHWLIPPQDMDSDWQVKALKVKLGSPQGMAADQAMFQAVQSTAQEIAPHIHQISVDANGGWTLDTARQMIHWLADRGVVYVEQPLPRGQEYDLQALSTQTPLPIFVDESCWSSGDIPALARSVQGINIKLMKSGGLSEALRMIHTAKAHGLQVMFGCYSDSALLNTALAQLSPLADHLDLDSHLNLVDDPFLGASFENGRIMPNLEAGLGVQLKSQG